MLSIARQGIGWSVLRDGALVKDDRSSGAHLTEASAVAHLQRVAADTGEEVQRIEWERQHSNGWIGMVVLNEDADLWWDASPGRIMVDAAQAADLEDAQIHATMKVVNGSNHTCDHRCGMWARIV